MQHKDEKTLYFKKELGKLISELRQKHTHSSCRRLAHEYGMYSGHLNMVENGRVECKVITLWKISEALGIKFSDFAKALEEKLGEDFKLMDE